MRGRPYHIARVLLALPRNEQREVPLLVSAATLRAVRRILVIAALLMVALLVGLPMLGGAPNLSALPSRDRAVAIGNGLELNVSEVGSGTPVVLVHGLPSNIGDWARVPEKLAALGHRVVVYDRAGYGWSSRPPVATDAYTLGSNARELGALLDQLEIPRAALVGWSYGGGIVQTFALDHPERVSQLVLLGSVGPAIEHEPRDFIGRLGRSPIGPAVFRYVTSVPSLGRGVLEDALANLFSGTRNIPPGFLDRSAAQMALPGTVDSWLAEERNGGYSQLRPEAIQTPTLVLHGDDDRAVAASVAEDLAKRLPNGKLVFVQGGSHMLPVTHPDLVAARVHEWVAQP
jgi:pimeloyl-ACP methyl ester carboxylesterase